MRQRLLAASFGAWHRQGSDGATDPLAEESLALAARPTSLLPDLGLYGGGS